MDQVRMAREIMEVARELSGGVRHGASLPGGMSERKVRDTARDVFLDMVGDVTFEVRMDGYRETGRVFAEMDDAYVDVDNLPRTMWLDAFAGVVASRMREPSAARDRQFLKVVVDELSSIERFEADGVFNGFSVTADMVSASRNVPVKGGRVVFDYEPDLEQLADIAENDPGTWYDL